MANTGWIPPEQRTVEAQRLTAEFHEQIQTFGAVGEQALEIPDRHIFAELEIKHHGKLLPRVRQITGSCVGAGAATAYVKTMLADIIFKQENEEVKPIFPYATYGVGRRKGGMRRPGEGSFGAAQAWACHPDNFGYLPWDDERVPKPSSTSDGWWTWTNQQEIAWSHPSAWPIPESTLTPDAKKYGITDVTRVNSVGDLVNGMANGYCATLASMFGTRPRVEGDVLIGRWNDSWAHQMSCPSFWKHPQHGMIFQIDNQWGPRAHPLCPTLSKLGVNGSFWMLERDMEKVIRTGEVYLHSSTGGFSARPGLWDMGIVFEDEA